MKTKYSFSDRPFSFLLLSSAALLLSVPAQAQPGTFNRSGEVAVAQNDAPVRYGSGGFAPTDLSASSSSSSSSGDDMRGGVVAATSSPATANSYQANLEERLSTLETQMRDMRGQLEEKDHQISQLQTRLDKALADMDMRLSQGGGGTTPPANANSASGNLQPGDMAGSGSTSMPPQPNADPNAPAPENSPTQKNLGTLNQAPGGASIPPASGDINSEYESAFAKLKAGDYQNAQVEFDKFLKAHPTHQLASNATYWYGETFYAQQKFTEAARIFAESYQKYPQSPKAPDSLLKLGMSLGGAGKNNEACVTLKQLKKQYATGNGTVLKRADSEMSKLSCS